MKTTIYYNPECSKCQNALCILEEKKEDIEIIEYLKTPPSSEQLHQLISQLGISAEQLVRKSEEIYLTHYKDKNFSEQEWIDIMVKDPVLIERPIVIKNNKAIIGRPPQAIIDIL